MTTFLDREILTTAQAKGPMSTLAAYFRLSGPGWLQSAITLGGGSLIGCLYLGMLGGTEMLWLQLVAITIGVIMLAAISYVTLSTKQRPYAAINEHINPVLGVGWLAATILANMIWILPQFSLCYDALDKNLIPGGLGNNITTQAIVSSVIAIAAIAMVWISLRPGIASKLFDWFLKLVIMAILLCFVAVVYWLATSGELNWSEILSGFVPDFSLWQRPTAELEKLISAVKPESDYWSEQIVGRQQENMISVAATAVGINMTFLLPYSMLLRGWDKPFRGLARFDLLFGLAIPFVIVTTCIVIAAGHAFHAKADSNLLSSNPDEIKQSVLFSSLVPVFEERLNAHGKVPGEYKQIIAEIEILQRQTKQQNENSLGAVDDLLDEAEQTKEEIIANYAAGLSPEERKLAAALVKPNVSQLAATLEPILGQQSARLLLGIGALGMGFSTIVILMLTNSLAFAEISGRFESFAPKLVGAIAAALVGACWFLIWTHESKTYLVIAASTFGAILLPIAYIAFFALMNSTRVLGDEKPRGGKLMVWNLLMTIAVVGAIAQAYGGISASLKKPVAGPIVIGGVVTFFLLALVGFSARKNSIDKDSE